MSRTAAFLKKGIPQMKKSIAIIINLIPRAAKKSLAISVIPISFLYLMLFPILFVASVISGEPLTFSVFMLYLLVFTGVVAAAYAFVFLMFLSTEFSEYR
jgi:hypothetical protein